MGFKKPLQHFWAGDGRLSHSYQAGPWWTVVTTVASSQDGVEWTRRWHARKVLENITGSACTVGDTYKDTKDIWTHRDAQRHKTYTQEHTSRIHMVAQSQRYRDQHTQRHMLCRLDGTMTSRAK